MNNVPILSLFFSSPHNPRIYPVSILHKLFDSSLVFLLGLLPELCIVTLDPASVLTALSSLNILLIRMRKLSPRPDAVM
jgi:hypothetical protein